MRSFGISHNSEQGGADAAGQGPRFENHLSDSIDNSHVRDLLGKKRNDSLACSHGVSSELLGQLPAARCFWPLILSCFLTSLLFA